MLSRTTDPATSHAAAARVHEFRATHHTAILMALDVRPATVHEIAAATGIEAHAVGKRMIELERGGLALPMADTRRSPSGRPARVWRAL